jgi:hypothetical protein
MKKKMLLMGMTVIVLLLVVTGNVFASPADNIRTEIISNALVVTNYNDAPVSVAISIEYSDGNFTRFEYVTFSLGRKGFSNSTGQWSPPRGSHIVGFNINNVR